MKLLLVPLELSPVIPSPGLAPLSELLVEPRVQQPHDMFRLVQWQCAFLQKGLTSVARKAQGASCHVLLASRISCKAVLRRLGLEKQLKHLRHICISGRCFRRVFL